MRKLTREQRASVVKALCEGCSVNSTQRMTGVAKTSILRLLVDLGRVCMAHEETNLRGLFCQRIEADEIWGFNHCKDRQVPRAKADVESMGSVWTWYAIDYRSKAILSWCMGDRDQTHARAFMNDLADRLSNRPELTTDALGLYATAVFEAFAGEVDYAQLHKVYGTNPTESGHRYSPAECTGCTKHPIFGSPKLERVSTSGIERANLTLRMTQRRWTRLTNGHSKKIDNMMAAFALHAFHYNWVRPHASLGGKTPAMVLGKADRKWTVADLVGLLEADERRAIEAGKMKRGPYRPRKVKD